MTRLELLAVVWALKVFKPYLLAQPFLVRTDHNSLRWLLNFKEPSGQVARWLDFLAQFRFSIEHRPGSQHRNADGLSRQPVQAVLLKEDLSKLVRETQNDTNLKLVVERLEKKETCLPGDSKEVIGLLKQAATLVVRDGLLYRDCDNKFQLVVPHSCRQELLRQMHASPAAGHFGRDRTLRRMRNAYYWPGMSSDVDLYCRACVECEISKPPKRYARAPLGTIKASFPFDVVAMDIMGPLPLSAKGNQYMLVIADYFSKWISIFPIPNQTAETVARVFVNRFVSHFGVPCQLHTDQGPCFESLLMKEICKLLGISKTRTTPYRPQSDGLVERANRTIKGALKTFITEKNVPVWDDFLPLLQLAYNSSVHTVTGFTPYYVLYGQEMRLPAHVLFPPPEGGIPVNVPIFVKDLQIRLAEVASVVKTKMEQRFQLAKERYDQTAIQPDLKVGSYVWLKSVPPPGVSPKFFRIWSGPWQVQRTKGVVVTIVRVGPLPTPRHARELTVHVDRLRPVQSNIGGRAPVQSESQAGVQNPDPIPAPFVVDPRPKPPPATPPLMPPPLEHPDPQNRPPTPRPLRRSARSAVKPTGFYWE